MICGSFRLVTERLHANSEGRLHFVSVFGLRIGVAALASLRVWLKSLYVISFYFVFA